MRSKTLTHVSNHRPSRFHRQSDLIGTYAELLAGLGAAALLAMTVPAVAGPYEDCILQNMKGVQDRLAAVEVKRACLQKTTPRKCRQFLTKSGSAQPRLNWIDFDLDVCLADCAEASWWSRTFGECRTD
jgi:hypothetical protein